MDRKELKQRASTYAQSAMVFVSKHKWAIGVAAVRAASKAVRSGNA
jgi:hypothetical protein